jgi:hypothetical protein
MSGSIRQLKNDYWLLRVDQGRDPLTGRRIQASKTVSGNRKAAERALDELKFSIRNQITTPSTLTLSVLIDLWAESLTKNGRKRSTSSLYHTRKRYVRYAEATIGSRPISSLKSTEITMGAFFCWGIFSSPGVELPGDQIAPCLVDIPIFF